VTVQDVRVNPAREKTADAQMAKSAIAFYASVPNVLAINALEHRAARSSCEYYLSNRVGVFFQIAREDVSSVSITSS